MQALDGIKNVGFHRSRDLQLDLGCFDIDWFGAIVTVESIAKIDREGASFAIPVNLPNEGTIGAFFNLAT